MNTQVARKLLANMPDEVFGIYIVPLIQLHGWPFESLDTQSPDTALWMLMFDNQSVKMINQLSWKRYEMPFSLAVFHPRAQRTIFGLLDEHIRGIPTPYANVINTKARFRSCREFIARTGRMPVPVVLQQDPMGLRILDGNHRLAAMASFANSSNGIVDCWIGRL